MDKVYQQILKNKEKNHKSFAVLIDPDNVDNERVKKLVSIGLENKIEYFFVGGSLITNNNLNSVIRTIKENCNIPVILFPGNNMHIDAQADAILFLSLISGRNPELLIGQHVIAAPILKRTPLEILSTGYMLIDGGKATTVSYISNTSPMPADKPSIAACTAMAGEMLGMKLIYMDAGSGASVPVNMKMVATVKRSISSPLIVGGGLNSVEKVMDAIEAGADIVVVGNGIEDKLSLLIEVSEKINDLNKTNAII